MTNADVEARHDVTVAVVREKGARFQIERASIDPPRPDDVVVRVVATGVCHTDMLVRDQDYPVPLPAVLGHDGHTLHGHFFGQSSFSSFAVASERNVVIGADASKSLIAVYPRRIL